MTISAANATYITLAYADIFDYPLTDAELGLWMVFVNGEKQKVTGGFLHYLPGRKHIIATRKKRKSWSKKKWEIAKKVGGLLRLVPTIQLVGVTGGLTMNNAGENDDIDLFFIVAPGSLWTSRLLATILMELVGKRRRPNDQNVTNKICLNMFMSSGALALPQKERDLFTAHEVLQMEPLWERSGTYQEFLQANSWVRTFLPNAWHWRIMNYELRIMNQKPKIKKHSVILHTSYFILQFIEPLAKMFQLWYMKRHRTTEVVTDTIVRFHPRDARLWIKEKLARRLGRQNLPLDKIFYGR